MFDHHKKSPWFAEKYDPSAEFQTLRMRVRKEGWKGRMDIFLHDLESGKFDPDLSEPELEPSSPVSADNTSTEVNGAVPPTSGDEAKQVGGGDDEMQFTVDADEEPGDNDAGRPDANGKSASDGKRHNRGEEASVLPEGNQVMIRTIPPDIGRVKLEEVCSLQNNLWAFIHLTVSVGMCENTWLCISGVGRSLTKAQLLPSWLVEVP
jgi:SERRATE/Ars2, N-terminal domain